VPDEVVDGTGRTPYTAVPLVLGRVAAG
jgi:hypothetical protein